MLSRFDYATAEGLYSDAGFMELENKSPEQAAELILERLALNEGNPKDHYAKLSSSDDLTARTSIPNNLLRIQTFFGRKAELAQIREALDPDNRTWGALIDGPGGMGKTSLAVRAAYDCTPDEFKRIIFVSVKNRELDDDGVRELGIFVLPGFLEMLNELSRELDRADITKAPEDERIRLLLEALCDEEPAKTALRSLANRSLVVPDIEEKAFALVPMVADFLRRRKPEVVMETGDRLEKCAY
jgi:hypothetical protein